VSLDAHLDLHRSEYFGAIRSSIGRSYEPGYDATPFVAFFLEAFSSAADHLLERIRGLGNVQISVRRDVVEGGLVPPMLDALLYAWINRSLRPADYQRITGRPPSTATRDLAQAVELGYLEPVGERRSRWYRLGERLRETPAVDEPADPRQLVPRV
jgi:Fic family protein